MKRTLTLSFLSLILLFSCAREDYSSNTYANESSIYSEDESATFRNILFVLTPYIEQAGEKKYLVTDTIKNIRVNINGKDWGTFNSIPKDTATFDYSEQADFLVSNIPVKYSVIAPVGANDPDTLSTAGEYSDMLNNYFTLSPGFYLCEVNAFDLKLENGDIRTINPHITEPLEIKEGMTSIFLGEFEVLVSN
ncbi:MAG: hypothetical protein U9N85_11005 [Bacteroidota bacterium]|nr:hypothetical protein [Bacteroidota bacterium]